jgi:hypothetical protein
MAEQAYEQRADGLEFLNAPYWKQLRSDPRFRAISNKVGLPQ